MADHAPESSRSERALRALNRLVGSRVFKLGFALVVLAGALFLARHSLKGASLAAVWASLRATSPWSVLAAALALVASFVCLGVTEYYALAYEGHRLKPARAFGVSLASYALAYCLGLGPATVSAARLRFYRSDGLDAMDVAAVTVLAGAAVTLGGLICAGAGLMVGRGLPLWVRIAGLGLIAPAALWFTAFTGDGARILGVRFKAAAPPRERALALAAAVVDWILSGGALFLLLQHPPLSEFGGFIAIFVLGSVISSVSGVPAGIGVFEAVVLALQSSTANVHQTAAALILYRAMNLAPALGVTAWLTLRQLVSFARPSRRKISQS